MSVTWNAVGSDKSLKDMSGLTIKHIDDDYTTNANGNVDLGISTTDYVVVAVYSDTNGNTICEPLYSGNSWWASLLNASTKAKIANESRHLHIFYVNRTW